MPFVGTEFLALLFCFKQPSADTDTGKDPLALLGCRTPQKIDFSPDVVSIHSRPQLPSLGGCYGLSLLAPTI